MSDRGEVALRGLHLHIDGASGAAGDMMLGALLDLGVPREVIDQAFDRIGLGRARLGVERVLKHGLAAVNVTIRVGGSGQRHGHGPGESHAHHPYRDVVAQIRAAGLDEAVEASALDMFERVARAEAHLHGTAVDEVSFHEVGAIDSIADIVGTAAGLAFLAPVAVTASPVAMGHGTIATAHGILPVPSPAALEILRAAGGMTCDGGAGRELCTPTGAAILAHAVTAWTSMPALQPVAVGHGAGDAELADRPNVLRLVLGRLSGAPAPAADETIYRIESNVDDMSPAMCEHAAEVMVGCGGSSAARSGWTRVSAGSRSRWPVWTGAWSTPPPNTRPAAPRPAPMGRRSRRCSPPPWQPGSATGPEVCPAAYAAVQR